ncbi:hypothetical protein PR202_ga22176 [Eleusine coracana subsp. coracana]|uniref:Protein kinase domain-containing protein n=1 Tax=Eleusine coracana subsp. coracana TaxID=191504 RepID=A0AAV5D397_ELECO|nr:hypothetical protein PR202_ga22176 [Eleusine coracana subsp. coracana]
MPASCPVLLALFCFLLLSGGLASAQQPYGKFIDDCRNPHNDTAMLGYFCGTGAAPSCRTYLTFTAKPPYSTPTSIAAHLGADAAALASANSIANENTAFPSGTKVLVPTTCGCTPTPSGRFYQSNASYVVRSGDLLVTIAKDAFQGLSTCQALVARGAPDGGEVNATGLFRGQPLAVPLRCACPSAAQAAAGVRFLVSYAVVKFDDVSAVAARFGVEEKVVVDANEMQSPFTVFPQTTLLIPLAAPPNASQIQSSPTPPSPPPPPVPVATPPRSGKSGNRTGVYIGVGVAVAAVAAVGTFLALRARRRRNQRQSGAVLPTSTPPSTKKGGKVSSNDKSALTTSTFTATGASGGEEASTSFSDAFSSSVVSLSDIKSSLKVYTYAELRAATDDFSPDRRVGNNSGGGWVYRAEFNGDAAAVEVVDRDVAAEVEIMRKVNHLNLIRLVGLCHHHGRWYLVTEFAEHGALRDYRGIVQLSWAQRVQVALDVAEGLRYLHEYADPPCVHMDVSSGTVLLAGGDGPPRAKLRGFAAARNIAGARDGEKELVFTMTSRIAGTRGYMAPEYLEHGVVSPKADVYSLGVVMLELVTGKDVEELVGEGVGDPFVELRWFAEEHAGDEDAVRRRVEELVDPALLPPGSCCPSRDAVLVMVKLIERCVRRNAVGRPTTGEVAQRLLKLSGVSVVSWQGSRDSEPPRSPGK